MLLCPELLPVPLINVVPPMVVVVQPAFAVEAIGAAIEVASAAMIKIFFIL